MKQVLTILFFLFFLSAQSQVYHERNDGIVSVYKKGMTELVVEFPKDSLVDVTSEYQGTFADDIIVYKYNWTEKEGRLFNHRGLLVTKLETGDINSVWMYEDTPDGRAKLSHELRENN